MQEPHRARLLRDMPLVTAESLYYRFVDEGLDDEAALDLQMCIRDSDLADALQANEMCEMGIANAVWTAADVAFEKDYLDIVRDDFAASAYEADFGTKEVDVYKRQGRIRLRLDVLHRMRRPHRALRAVRGACGAQTPTYRIGCPRRFVARILQFQDAGVFLPRAIRPIGPKGFSGRAFGGGLCSAVALAGRFAPSAGIGRFSAPSWKSVWLLCDWFV